MGLATAEVVITPQRGSISMLRRFFRLASKSIIFAATLVAVSGPAGAQEPFSGFMTIDGAKRAAQTGLIIRRSNGGQIGAAYELRRARMLIIDGPCYSACAWAFVENRRACFTPRASFAFHAVSGGTRGHNTFQTTWLVHGLRPSLRSRVAHALKSGGLAHFSARQMRLHYPDRDCSRYARGSKRHR